jgi:hypothetical protein
MEIRNGSRIDTVLVVKANSNINVLNVDAVTNHKKAGILKAITKACKEFVAVVGKEPTTIYVGSTEHSMVRDALNELETKRSADNPDYKSTYYGYNDKIFWNRVQVRPGCNLANGRTVVVAWDVSTVDAPDIPDETT